MGIDTSKINGTRFMFTIAFFLQSSALLTSLIASLTLNNSWLSGLFAFFACIPLIYIYKTIMVKFPDKNLIQVLKIVYGKIFGSIIGATYVWFFLTLTALSISDLGDFAKITVMFQTPKIVLTLLCIIVSVFAVRHGLGVVTRYSAAFTFLEFAIVGLSILLVLNQLDFSNFLPIFNLPIGKYLQSIHIASTIPMGELVVFLMLTPNIKINKKKIMKYWFGGFAMGIGTLLIVILRDTAILGNVLHLFTLPGLITLRLVNIGATLSRMEIIFAAALMMLLFFKITLLLYISVRAISSLFELTTFKNLTLIVGVFLAFYAVTLFIDPVLHAQSAQKSVVIVWTLFEILIPILTLIIALFRKLPKNNEKEKAIIKKTDYKIQLNYQWLKYKKKESKSSKTKQKTAKQGG